MLYYDVGKDISVFAAGKHGTCTMHDSVARVYKDTPFTLDKTLQPVPESYTVKVDYDIPYYNVVPEGYWNWRELGLTKKNYVIIREPIDRMISGLCTNLRIEAWRRRIKECPVEGFPNEEVIWDIDYETNAHHIGPYLQFLEINSIFVPFSLLNTFWEDILGVTPKKLNDSHSRLLLGNERVEYSHYFRKEIENQTHPDFDGNLQLEQKAWNNILAKGEIYEKP